MNLQPTDNPPPFTPEDRLERYLDGLMSPQEQAAFEADSAADSTIAAQIAAHRKLASVLGKFYDASNLPASGDALPAPLPLTKHAPRRLLKLAAIAAAAFLPVCAAAYFFLAPKAPQPVVLKTPTSAEFQQRNRTYIMAEYQKQVDSGFKPHEVCTTDAQFAKWTSEAFGHALTPVHPAPGSNAPAEPVLAGWSKGTVFSSYSGLLLAHVDGKPVMVVMDSAPDRMVPHDDPTSSPRIFSRKVNDVWMIEVTPLNEPRVITNIEAAPAPAPPAP